MKPGIHNIENLYKGDTYDGLSFALNVDGVPIDLTNVTAIKMQVLQRKKGCTAATVVKTLELGTGFTIQDALLGTFTLDPFIVDFGAGIFSYDIQVTFSGGVIKTYIAGHINVIESVTDNLA